MILFSYVMSIMGLYFVCLWIVGEMIHRSIAYFFFAVPFTSIALYRIVIKEKYVHICRHAFICWDMRDSRSALFMMHQWKCLLFLWAAITDVVCSFVAHLMARMKFFLNYSWSGLLMCQNLYKIFYISKI